MTEAILIKGWGTERACERQSSGSSVIGRHGMDETKEVTGRGANHRMVDTAVHHLGVRKLIAGLKYAHSL